MDKNILLLCFFVLCFSIRTFAFEFLPSVVNYEPEGRGASQKYTAHNSSAEPISLEISASTREIDELGVETLKPTTDFNLYPKLFTLKPGDSRTVKITYIGEKKIKIEHAYRIVAEQLSLEQKKREASASPTIGINFLMKYETSAYVVPAGASPNVIVKNFSSLQDPKKGRLLQLQLENIGDAHEIFQNWSLIINRPNAAPLNLVKTKNQDLPEFNLLAGQKIKISIPWPVGLENMPESVSVKTRAF